MRIEVSVPGIRNERGKLPAPAALQAPRLPLSLASGELAGVVFDERMTGTELGTPIATAHPVSAKMTRSTPIWLASEPIQRLPPSSGVKLRRVAPPQWRKAFLLAPRCGQPA